MLSCSINSIRSVSLISGSKDKDEERGLPIWALPVPRARRRSIVAARPNSREICSRLSSYCRTAPIEGYSQYPGVHHIKLFRGCQSGSSFGHCRAPLSLSLLETAGLIAFWSGCCFFYNDSHKMKGRSYKTFVLLHFEKNFWLMKLLTVRDRSCAWTIRRSSDSWTVGNFNNFHLLIVDNTANSGNCCI